MAKLKKRQRDILQALQDLGGEATTRQIAERTGLHVNGVSQSLGALQALGGLDSLGIIGGKGGETRWKIVGSKWTLAALQGKLV